MHLAPVPSISTTRAGVPNRRPDRQQFRHAARADRRIQEALFFRAMSRTQVVHVHRRLSMQIVRQREENGVIRAW